jgi:hypothetical protein
MFKQGQGRGKDNRLYAVVVFVAGLRWSTDDPVAGPEEGGASAQALRRAVHAVQEICATLHIGRSTLYRYVKEESYDAAA